MITIFAIPKPFLGHIGTIQRNAIISWTLLEPRPEIILFGKDEGVEDICRELGLLHMPDIEYNRHGTPLLNFLFEKTEKIAKNDLLGYINPDVILMDDFMPAVAKTVEWNKSFLLTGERWDLDQEDVIDYSNPDWKERLRRRVCNEAESHGHGGVDYFIFPKGALGEIPPFAVGRKYYDCWFFWKVSSQNIPVVDATEIVTCIHQNHERTYTSIGRKPLRGEDRLRESVEARENFKLTGGGYKNIYTSLCATHSLTVDGIITADTPKHLLKRIRELETKERGAANYFRNYGQRIESFQKQFEETEQRNAELAADIEEKDTAILEKLKESVRREKDLGSVMEQLDIKSDIILQEIDRSFLRKFFKTMRGRKAALLFFSSFTIAACSLMFLSWYLGGRTGLTAFLGVALFAFIALYIETYRRTTEEQNGRFGILAGEIAENRVKLDRGLDRVEDTMTRDRNAAAKSAAAIEEDLKRGISTVQKKVLAVLSEYKNDLEAVSRAQSALEYMNSVIVDTQKKIMGTLEWHGEAIQAGNTAQENIAAEQRELAEKHESAVRKQEETSGKHAEAIGEVKALEERIAAEQRELAEKHESAVRKQEEAARVQKELKDAQTKMIEEQQGNVARHRELMEAQKRQQDKSARLQVIQEAIKKAQEEMGAWQKEIVNAQRQREVSQEKQNVRIGQLVKASEAIASLQNLIRGLEGGIKAAREETGNARKDAAGIKGDIQGLRKEQQDLLGRSADIQKQMKSIHEEVEKQRKEAEKAQKELADLRERQTKKIAQLVEIQNQVKMIGADSGAGRKDILAYRAELTDIKKQQGEKIEKLIAIQERFGKLQDDIGKRQNESRHLQQDILKAQKELLGTQGKHQDKLDQLASLQNELKKAQNEFNKEQIDSRESKQELRNIKQTLKQQDAKQLTEYREFESLLALYATVKPHFPLPSTRKSAISPDFAKILVKLIKEKQPGIIVELGSGVSTIISGYALGENGKGKIVSLEEDPMFAKVTKENIKKHDLSGRAKVIYAPLKNKTIKGKKWRWYDTSRLKVGSIDMLVIDGPQQYGRKESMVRFPALPLLFKLLSKDAVIVVDDASREDEKKTINKWIKDYKLKCQYIKTEKGAAVLRR